jgi:gliding motility-associated-like protein
MSYTCPRDTTIGCNTSCFTLYSKIPDIRELGTDYTLAEVPQVSPCRPYDLSEVGGASTYLSLDDRYSGVINIGFTFPFYGVNYTQLLASDNGTVCFDLARANQFSQWSLTAGNVPNTGYDAALIMGPYHDLYYPAGGQYSPNLHIKYNLFGTAPNRKWVLSYYKVPMFSCNSLIENTHQIVLHETTGIIDVFIKDKQICAGWNSGRAMVGLQDQTRTKGIMAPNRRATDPPWGSVGMTEVWRFYPIGGSPLYRSVQLLNQAGALVATGDTTRLNENTFSVNFPNVCPPAGNNMYVVKTTYRSITDPNATVFSLDTVYVNKTPQLPVTSSIVNTTCGQNVGSATVTAATNSTSCTFSIDGGAPQTVSTSPLQYTFNNLSGGNHTVTATDGSGCTNTITINVGASSAVAPPTPVVTACSCPGVNNGSITVTPTNLTPGNTALYLYTLNSSGAPQTVSSASAGVFTNLQPGTYTVTILDPTGCTVTTANSIVTAGTALSTSFPTTTLESCPGSGNGSATVSVTTGSGVAPYSFTMVGSNGYNQTITSPVAGPNSVTFTGLAGLTSPYSITIVDAVGCRGIRTATVSAGTGITSTTTNTPTTCAGVNNATFTVTPTSGLAPYQFSIDGGVTWVPTTPQPAGPYTFTGLASGSQTVTIRDATGCQGTKTAVLTDGTGVSASATSTPTSCAGVNNGTILVTSTGTAPFTYSLDASPFVPAFSPTATFINVSSGPHTIIVKDNFGCQGTTSVNVGVGTGFTGTIFSSTPTSCPGINNGTLTVIPPATGTTATPTYQFSIDNGVTWVPTTPQSGSYQFTGLAPAGYLILVRDNLRCQAQVPAFVIAGNPLTSIATTDSARCSNINNGSITIVPSNAGSYSYTLTPGPTQTSPTFSNLAPGSYTYSFSTIPSGGCGGNGTAIVRTNPPIAIPATTFTTTQPLCNGESNGIVTLAPTGGVPTYQYSIDAGTTYQASANFNTLNAGSHTIRIKDNVGCLKDTTFILGEPTLLTASATSTAGTCNGDDGQIIVSGLDGTPGYTYSINGGTSYQASPNFTVSGGNYPNIKVKDNNGCVANTSVNVTLIDNMVVTPVNDTTVCFGSSVTLVPNFSDEATIFIWSTIPDPTLINTLNNSNIENPVATPNDTTTYEVKARWGVCERSDIIVVRVLHKPIPNAGPNYIICQYDSCQLLGSATNLSGTVNYEWTPSSIATTPFDQNTMVDPLTTAIFTLTVKDNYGCNFAEKDTVKVTVQPPLPANAGRDTIAISGQPHQLLATGGPDAVEFTWTPSFPLNSSNIFNPIATLSQDQMFVVTIRDIGGCIGKDSIFVRVLDGAGVNRDQPLYYVPNSFTPNGDGLNDVFRGIPAGMRTTDYFRVYDRFGKLIFETNRYLRGWDGTYQGKPQPTGTYVYIIKGIDKNGKPVLQKQTVLLIR